MKKYVVIYEKTDSGFSAYAPDLDGCIACGPTLDETERLMRRAIELYIEELEADGKPVPEPNSLAKWSH